MRRNMPNDLSDDLSDSESDTDTSFNSAADAVQRIHTMLNPQSLLQLYGLYKQSTIGQCDTPKPGIFNMQARSKWIAWHDLGDMDPKEAKCRYIELVSQLDPSWDDFVCRKKDTNSWVVHSKHIAEYEEEIAEDKKSAFDYVKEGNLAALKKVITIESINELEEKSGMGLIHWATDRDADHILEYLLSLGADVNLKDKDGQTSAHYAASCGHANCLGLLLKFGIDKTIRDNDGATVMDVAETRDILDLLQN